MKCFEIAVYFSVNDSDRALRLRYDEWGQNVLSLVSRIYVFFHYKNQYPALLFLTIPPNESRYQKAIREPESHVPIRNFPAHAPYALAVQPFSLSQRKQ